MSCFTITSEFNDDKTYDDDVETLLEWLCEILKETDRLSIGIDASSLLMQGWAVPITYLIDGEKGILNPGDTIYHLGNGVFRLEKKADK